MRAFAHPDEFLGFIRIQPLSARPETPVEPYLVAPGLFHAPDQIDFAHALGHLFRFRI